MFFLNTPHTFANIAAFLRCRTGEWPEDLDRRQFFLHLAQTQKIRLSSADDLVVSFEDTTIGRTLLEKGMLSEDDKSEIQGTQESERRMIARNITHAAILLNALDYRLGQILHFMVSDVVCIKTAASAGGTASNLLGVIWISPQQDWTTIDYAECLLHELVHNTVFLGDMLHRLYIDPRSLQRPDALVVSAIRKVPRAIDKSLHSACVSASLVYFYRLLGEEAQADSFLESLRHCVSGLAEKKDALLTPYGCQLVAQLQRFVETPTVKWVSQQIDDGGLAIFDNGETVVA